MNVRRDSARSLLKIVLLTLLAPLGGCSSANLSPPAGIPDSGSCLVEASQYPNVCTADSECVAVPTGGNACDPCGAGSGDWSCNLSALPASQASTYTQTLSVALSPYAGTAQEDQCIVQSCPTGMKTSCVAGVCVIQE